MHQLINEFLLENIMPGFRKTFRNHNILQTIGLIVGRVHKDVMIGARYKTLDSSVRYCEHNQYYQDLVVKLIVDNLQNLSGRKIIEQICDDRTNIHHINIGLIQKLINMAIKYLYVIQVCEINVGFQISFIESYCDCPLDSKILDRLSSDTGKKYTAWTKLVDVDEYKEIQDDIKNVKEFALEYDFEHWGL